MLKVANEAEEQRGNRLMVWWDGEGSAPVMAHDDRALLMARAVGGRSLTRMALKGDDDEASRILCRVVAHLHSRRGQPPFELADLVEWFAPLTSPIGGHGARWLDLAAATARELLQDQRELVVMHGDIHHGNVLDFGEAGWLAIDPKGLLGERTFDFVNLLRNPCFDVATAPGRLTRQASVVASEANLDRVRLLHWVLSFLGLSAIWSMEEGDKPELDVAIANIVAAELGMHT